MKEKMDAEEMKEKMDAEGLWEDGNNEKIPEGVFGEMK